MSVVSKPVALAVGALIGSGLTLSGAAFAATPLVQGYMVAADGTAAAPVSDGRCGEGQCGEGMCGEGKCGGAGSCGEGKCEREAAPTPAKGAAKPKHRGEDAAADAATHDRGDDHHE